MASPLTIANLRGRNGADAPLDVPDDQCCEAINVDFSNGGLVRRRGGCEAIGVTFSSGGPFATRIRALMTHLPGTDETVLELWAVDNAGQICRLAGATTWTEPTLVDAFTGTDPEQVSSASLGGLFFLAYDSAQNRLHVWDSSLSSVRRVGMATPAAPSVATQGGAGNTFTRYYRVRYLDVSGSDTRRMSEPSASATISITDDAGVTVTKPAALSEDETHWIVEYADADAGPWYVASAQIAVGTTTYSDTEASVDTTNELSAEEGLYTAPPSFKYVRAAGARLLLAGAWETSGGAFVPSAHEVYWTPVLGATDIGDSERVPSDYRVALDHAVSGISEVVNGVTYVFGPRAYSALIPTSLPGAGAFQRITESLSIGCLDHLSVVSAEDEAGRPCVYFLSHRGPYRVGPAGLQYLGRDIEDVWATVLLTSPIFYGLYYDALQQVWWTVETSSGYRRLVFDVRLGRTDGADVRGGWAIHLGTAVTGYAATMFATSIGTTMGIARKPYMAPYDSANIYRCDTGTDDAGTDFQGYIDTKEYAPAGLGRNCSLLDPLVLGEASATALVTVAMHTDFGRDTTVTGQVTLAPDYAETHVLRKVEGVQTSEVGTVRFRIGDNAACDPGFGTLDAFVVQVEDAGPR